MPTSKSSWSDDQSTNSTQWARASGIDDSIPAYDDSTLSYDQVTEYYDGYDASTITTEDVNFDLWSETGLPNHTAWLDNEDVVSRTYDDSLITYDDASMFYDGHDPS